MIKSYKTHNLDEAAYLMLRGFRCESHSKTKTSAEFIFKDAGIDSYIKDFWTRGSLIELHSWLAVRQALKNEIKAQLYVQEMNHLTETRGTVKDFLEDPTAYEPKTGEAYFYVLNGSVFHALYGNSPAHELRVRSGNCFKTRNAALIAKNFQ